MKFGKVLIAAAMLGVFSAMPAFAENIEMVKLDVSPSGDEDIQPGQSYGRQEPKPLDASYKVASYGTENVKENSSTVGGTQQKSGKKNQKNQNLKTPFTYTIELTPTEGNSFSDNVVAEVKGSYEVSIESKAPDKLKIKAKAYPFYVLKNVSGIEQSGKSYKWSKVDNAASYDVVIYYASKDGDEKTAKKNVTTPKISVSSYQNGGKEVDHISVRAKHGGDKQGHYVANSQYVESDGSTDANFDDTIRFDLVTARSNGAAVSSDGTSANSSAAGPASGDGWKKVGEDWSYLKGNQKQTGWINPEGDDWYLLDQNGKMLTGWNQIDGKWYYLDTDATQKLGRMLSGWRNIGGSWYYLNPERGSSLPFGAMYADTQTPDGYHVNTNGVWQ